MAESPQGEHAQKGGAATVHDKADTVSNFHQHDLRKGQGRTVSFQRNAPFTVVPQDVNNHLGSSPNRIKTTRFTPLTWLPKSLFVQFQRAANIFFLFVSILTTLEWSPTMWSSTLLPFCGVLLWTALKDLYEDIRKKRDDDAENKKPCQRFDFQKKAFVEARWKDIVCGDVLLTCQDEALPADVLLALACGGQAFISTVNLDGETNLKERRTPDLISLATEKQGDGKNDSLSKAELSSSSFMQAEAVKCVETLGEIGLVCELDEPKAGLTDMGTLVKFRSPSPALLEAIAANKIVEPCLLHYENFVPRGCVLRNTAWMVSIASYVGDESKTRLNTTEISAKISNMQHYLNRAVVALVCTLLLFCLYAAAMAQALQEDPEYNYFIAFLIYWIILYQIVPISLYVCFEILKLVLGFLITWDKQMADPKTGKKALARTADLVEELGQIDFIFSDKTGTLTENEMVFARCCIACEDMGDFRRPRMQARLSGVISKEQKQAEESESSKVIPKGVEKVMQILSAPNPMRAEVRWFFFCLVTCHTAQVEEKENGELIFQGSSPDEVAFLDAARTVGVKYRSRKRLPGQSGYEVTVQTSGDTNDQHVFNILCEIPFTSERKRMTIVAEYKGELFCITKGADNVMNALCDEPFDKPFVDALQTYSKQGLRTLAIASKLVDRAFFDQWRRKLTIAISTPMAERDAAMDIVAREMEIGLELSGISAIEDKLQEGVPESIERLKAAGIRFWVLTGDKTETAVEIVRACSLFTDDMPLAYMIGCRSTEHALELLKAARIEVQGQEHNAGLILDGTFVKHCLESQLGPSQLFDLAMASRACVCCRLSPQQKRKLVELVKALNKKGVTLAIGDGANDVSMIQGAHVGIGIRGKEGNQAVQASDVALSQFRFIVPLLLCHGRRAYRRVALFLCYYVYKHVALAVGDMLWAHQYKFRYEIAYPEWLSSAYSVAFTSLPVLVALSFDSDLPDSVVVENPQLYHEGLDRTRFNCKVFTLWMISGIWHGGLAWLMPSLTVGSTEKEIIDGEERRVLDFWAGSCVSFTLVIFFVNLRLWMVAMNPGDWKVIGIILLSCIAYIAYLFVLGETAVGVWMSAGVDGVPTKIFTEGKYLMLMFLTPLGLLIDLAIFEADRQLNPSPLTKARRQLGRRE